MSQENKMIPEVTVLAYSKVNLERQGLLLELRKLEKFLNNPRHVSKDMLNVMKEQFEEMNNYFYTLSKRISIFEKENPGIIEYKNNTLGIQTIGTFNPSGNPQIEEIKNRSAQLINAIEAFGKSPRRNSIAITDIEKAQMMAVKSIFN